MLSNAQAEESRKPFLSARRGLVSRAVTRWAMAWSGWFRNLIQSDPRSGIRRVRAPLKAGATLKARASETLRAQADEWWGLRVLRVDLSVVGLGWAQCSAWSVAVVRPIRWSWSHVRSKPPGSGFRLPQSRSARAEQWPRPPARLALNATSAGRHRPIDSEVWGRAA